MNFYVEDFIRRLTYEKNYAQSTTESYNKELLKLAHFLKKKEIIDASSTDIKKYMESLESLDKKLSPASISLKHSCFRSFFKDLIRMNVRDDNPMDLIEYPQPKRKFPDVIGETELEGLFEFLEEQKKLNDKKYFMVIRDIMIFEMLYSCGLRVSELCSLTLNNIYMDEGVLRVLGKGDKERLLPIGSRLKKLLEEYLPVRSEFLEGANCEYVITSKFRKHVSRMFVWKVIKKYSSDMEIDDLHPHTLRHAFASHMLSRGADLRVIQELLGHKSIATTEIYTHVTKDHLHEELTLRHPLSRNQIH